MQMGEAHGRFNYDSSVVGMLLYLICLATLAPFAYAVNCCAR